MSRVGSPQTLLTVTLLTLCTGLGMVLDDLGFVAAVSGCCFFFVSPVDTDE